MNKATIFTAIAAFLSVSGLATSVAVANSRAARVDEGGGPVGSVALEAPVAPSLPRDIVEFTSSVVEVPEVTIVGIVPARHAVESDAAHMARLISAPLHCGDLVQTMGTGEIAGTSGAPRVRYCR